jgi:hypothetical protein
MEITFPDVHDSVPERLDLCHSLHCLVVQVAIPSAQIIALVLSFLVRIAMPQMSMKLERDTFLADGKWNRRMTLFAGQMAIDAKTGARDTMLATGHSNVTVVDVLDGTRRFTDFTCESV